MTKVIAGFFPLSFIIGALLLLVIGRYQVIGAIMMLPATGVGFGILAGGWSERYES